MVKDDLAAFQAAFAAYDHASRNKAREQYFHRMPRPIFYGFWFSFGVVLLFAISMGVVMYILVNDGEKDMLMFSILGVVSVMALVHHCLLKKYDSELGKSPLLSKLLTNTYYQAERYLLFKRKLGETYLNKSFPCERVKSLIQSRLQLNEGIGLVKSWVLGLIASVIITILYALAPSSESEKLVYVAVISFLLLLVLFYAYFVHDPFWFKNNKLREMLLFISVYEAESSINDAVQYD